MITPEEKAQTIISALVSAVVDSEIPEVTPGHGRGVIYDGETGIPTVVDDETGEPVPEEKITPTISFERDGYEITIFDVKVDEHGALCVRLQVKDPEGEWVPVDNLYRFINPPLNVVVGERIEQKQIGEDEDGIPIYQTVKVPELKQDEVEVTKEIVFQAVMGTIQRLKPPED